MYQVSRCLCPVCERHPTTFAHWPPPRLDEPPGQLPDWPSPHPAAIVALGTVILIKIIRQYVKMCFLRPFRPGAGDLAANRIEFKKVQLQFVAFGTERPQN